MLIDHFAMTIIAVTFFIPEMIINTSSAAASAHDHSESSIFSRAIYYGILGFATYFCKDGIDGRSIAKRILKLQLINETTKDTASPLRCLVRNIFCILWPVEIIVAIVNPNRRIGDMIAGTRLVVYNVEKSKKSKFDFKKIALSFFAACGISAALVLPFAVPITRNSIPPYIESTFNMRESETLQKLFIDEQGSALTADVKVYDKIKNDSKKYVSVVVMMKSNVMENENEFNEFKSTIDELIKRQYPESVRRVKYLYNANGVRNEIIISNYVK